MKKIYVFALACLSLMFITAFSSLHAENRANSLTFSLGAGSEFFSSKRHIKNVTEPFLAAGYNITANWGIEALWGTFKTAFKDKTPDDRQVSGTLVLLNGLYHFGTYEMIEPYVMAGVGVTGLSPNRFDATNEGNINAGIGAQIFANKAVALRVDARDLYTLVGGKNDVYLDAGVTFFIDLC